MKCEGAKELFSELLEGSIDHALTTAVRDHINGCDSCKEDYEIFRLTWGMLGTLPEVVPQADFRHSVVMKAARLQHEKTRLSKGRFWSFDLPGFLKRVEPARAALVSAVVVGLVFFGPTVIHHFQSSPLPSPVPYIDTAEQGDVYTPNLDLSTKDAWQSRKLGRNTLWTAVEPVRDPDGRMVYRIRLAINNKALLQGDACGRLGVSVVLLPPDRFGTKAAEAGTLMWQGSILANTPVLVPAVFDYGDDHRGSMNLLIRWRFRQRDFSQVVYLPSNYRGVRSRRIEGFSVSDTDYMKSHTDLYSALQSIAQEYGVPIVANGRLTNASPAVAVGSGDLNWMLRSTLQPASLAWLAADSCVYVDRDYLSND